MVDVEALRAIHVADVIQQAVQARQVSYSPYRYVGCDLRSSFRVGAALLLEDGTIIVGANVENASYERSAIVKWKTEAEHRIKRIIGVGVSADTPEPCTPCGICRQVLREFCDQDTPVWMPWKDWTPAHREQEHVLTLTLAELLPNSFGPNTLHHRTR
ncbi:cytidine deaminase [Malassezia pachydermatis]|uniref:Cytidine deaminase n=1 Tax=Malassezia pachydermatis TaxID=77020 RepID=A0A0M8MUL0_9BASI|nr:cytidine deaminase [Malassezia pachydermatis]KOS13911.1 cytidine deaminase [Malassezia pachydermatis]